MNAQVLVVEDEPDVAALVAYHLARSSFQVRTVGDGSEALQAVEIQRPDLVVLDLMLPGMSGEEVLCELRRNPETQHVPVMILTARSGPQERIEGLSLGADDYLTKPFSPAELVLRAKAILRRVQQIPSPPGGKVLRIGPFVVDVASARAEMEGAELTLTPKEFKLLQTLIDRRGRVQSRAQLLQTVWGVSTKITTRTVDMHVQRLRTKLGANSEWIETVRGIGYRFRHD